MSPGLAQIREQLARKTIVEADRIEGEDSNGFTYSFDPTGRRKYIEVMKNILYSENPAYADADVSKGYFCGSCYALTQDSNTVTGYQCSKYLIPDRPYGCCAGHSEKDEE